MERELSKFCDSKFWDLKVTWNTENPDFTRCFEKTTLVWIPCGFLWLVAGFEIIYIMRAKNDRRIPNTALNLVQRAVVFLIILLQIAHFANSYRPVQVAGLTIINVADQVAAAIKVLTYCLAILLQTLNQRNGIHTSGPLLIFWFLCTACGVFEFQTILRQRPWNEGYEHRRFWLSFLIAMISYPLIVLEFILHFFCDKTTIPMLDESDPDDLKEGDDAETIENNTTTTASNNPCPELMASFSSKITFQWFWKLAWVGYKKPLEFDDLWDLNPEDQSRPLIKHFFKFWKPSLLKAQKLNYAKKEYMKQSKKDGSKTNTSEGGDSRQSTCSRSKKSPKKSKANILPVLIKANWDVFTVSILLKLSHDLLLFVSPQILNLLIQHASSKEESWKGYLYAVIIFLTGMLQLLLLTQYFQRVLLVGMRVRSGLVGAIYQKSLVTSHTARKEFTVGEIINFVSVDCQRFVDRTGYLNMIWSAPFQIILCSYFLWGVLGPAVFAGVAVLILLIPVNAWLANKMKELQIQQLSNKDQRVKLMNEILSGIKVLKLYAWEPSFQDQVTEIRQRELTVLRKSRILECCSFLVWILTPFLVSLASFGTFVLTDKGNILDARKAFVALTLFNIMRIPMSSLPVVAVFIIEAGVSLKRINKFMNADEIDEAAVTHAKTSDDDIAVSIQNGNFTWGDIDTLSNINLEVKKGSLVAVVGSVGLGKSSLLSAILGEMDKQSGVVKTVGSIAYVAQQAWIQNSTLRNNILFGKEFDPILYKQVINACALASDLEILPGGDNIEIGERGINLSGGQKQRVSLARATYYDADLYLFDDPLSAVDSHVGKHLFENVIGPQGILGSKTRVVVTHGITFLPYVDHIIVMNNGQISEAGSFSELLEEGGAFADFLFQHATPEILEIADKSTVAKLEAVIGSHSEILARQFSKDSEGDIGSSGTNIDAFRNRGVSLWSDGSGKTIKEAEEYYSVRRASRDGESLMRAKTRISATKTTTKEETVELEKEKLIYAEKTEVGSVKWDVYRHYMKSVGWGIAICILIFNFLYSGLSVFTNVWLVRWAKAASINGKQDKHLRDVYLGVYGGFGLLQAIALFCANAAMGLGNLKAARYLHNEMLTHILRSPMSFFDTTPLGRIVNRFSMDIDAVDSTFPENLRSWIAHLFQVLSTLVVISYSTPWFLVVIVPVGAVYFTIQRFYVASSRQLKRLEVVSRSPIYSHFSETLTGLVSIRAFSKQKQFIREFEDRVDHNLTAYYPSIIASRWLAVRLETLGNLIIFFAAILAVISHPDEGFVGLSVSYALNVTHSLNGLVRMTSDVGSNIVAVERIKEYGETPQEAAWEIPDKKPPPGWPQNGHIKFNGYQSRYRDGLDLIIKDVSCDIEAGEKVGIVGRTGAGKSSLTLGLFRIVEAAGGSIEIDDLDLSSMGLHDVRGNLTIIPQDPVLFGGTLRLNLDPFKRYRDSEIWHALEYAHLKQFVRTLPKGLMHAISEGGENLSVGQRQLVCLARALLRKTKILVLDEATAAVDLGTDDLIQRTIRSEFKDCTVLTIAHRLNTIMDCNRVMVCENGVIREFKNPQELLKDSSTVFYSMAKDSGIV